MPRSASTAEAAPPPAVTDAGDDDAAPDAAAILPVLTAPAGALDGFHAALDRAAAKDPGGRALVLVFGDSHTAGDQLTGTLRRELGKHFGQGGRGFVLPGKPAIRHYYLRDVAYGSSGKWQAELGGKRDNLEPFGLAGVRSHTADKKATAWVATCGSCPVDKVARFDIFHLRTKASGAFSYQVDDGAWIKVATKLPASAAEAQLPAVTSVDVPDGRHKLALKPAGGGPIELFGVALERTTPGVVVDALGVVGRRLAHLRHWDWDVIGPQLAARAPALVVLQYGTNEADDAKLDLGLVARLHGYRHLAAAPSASIWILGLDMGEGRRRAADKLRPPPDADAGVPYECQWHTPGVLPLVIDVQRQAAARNQVAFFDTFAAMGGGNLMDTFFHADPPLAYSDHIHFTQAGYEQWGRALGAALLDDHARWTQTDPTARSSGHRP
jgi:lysophospholipase L1-like esterase